MADKRPDAKALRNLPEADIRSQLAQLRNELWQGRLKAREGSLQQSHHLPVIRRQIARIETVLTEQRRAAASKPAQRKDA